MTLFVVTQKYFFTNEIQAIFKEYNQAQAIHENSIKDQFALDDTTKNIFLNSLKVLKHYQKANQNIVEEIYPNYFTINFLFPFVSGILAILTFFVTQKGWSQVSNELKTLFVLFAFTSAIVGLFPTIFKQKENINTNMNVYIENQKLQQTIYDFAKTYHLSIKRQADTLFMFFKNTDKFSLDVIETHFEMDLQEVKPSFIESNLQP
jgi:hypothetical protein